MLVALAAAFAFLAAPAISDEAAVKDTSFTADNGDRIMRLSVEAPASAHEIWQLISTAEGWKRWSVKTAFVDLREGGTIETSYREGAAKGDRDNIKNQIVAIAPERMLVFRNVQAPRDFRNPELFARVTSTIKIEPAGPTRSLVTYLGDGFGAGAEFDALYRQFLAGNTYTLGELRKAAAGR